MIGAGVFGAWTAYWLRKAGQNVALIDAYGPGNSRASSGGESRIIRAGYGADELYSRLALRALPMWKQLADDTGETLFVPTGVLWLADDNDQYTRTSLETVQRLGGKSERLPLSEIRQRWPQIATDSITWAAYEPESGVLMARRAVQTVVTRAISRGVSYTVAAAEPLTAIRGRVASIAIGNGERLRAGAFVFACGPWLPRVFPNLLGDRMFITRQEVAFFGVPAGATEFSFPRLPTWLQHSMDFYGMPDIESRGFKVSLDRHGARFDPDSGTRIASAELAGQLRAYLARRFPRLADAPIVEARVCQYENSSNGDFIIDRHPDCENVWIAGGGSGHGFKHGPVVGEYCAKLLLGKTKPEPRFSLAAKQTQQNRSVY